MFSRVFFPFIYIYFFSSVSNLFISVLMHFYLCFCYWMDLVDNGWLDLYDFVGLHISAVFLSSLSVGRWVHSQLALVYIGRVL